MYVIGRVMSTVFDGAGYVEASGSGSIRPPLIAIEARSAWSVTGKPRKR
jgi:hypothetical protein